MAGRKKNIDITKFKQPVHYILWHFKQDSENNLGSVKLNKILWLLDVREYCSKGYSMSGEECYIKREFGPVPPHILAACEDLDTEGVLQIKGHTEAGKIDICKAEVTKPEREDIGLLSNDELQRVNDICDELKTANSKQLSEYSHNDVVYNAYEDGEKIPLVAYLYSEAKEPTEEEIKWAEKGFEI